MKQLASDKNIVVLPPDKGRATVVMDREDYNTKIKALLDDRNTYKPMAKDPTSALERKMNSTLLDLRRADCQRKPTITCAALQAVFHACMDCPRSTNPTHLLDPLSRSFLHQHTGCPSSLHPC